MQGRGGGRGRGRGGGGGGGFRGRGGSSFRGRGRGGGGGRGGSFSSGPRGPKRKFSDYKQFDRPSLDDPPTTTPSEELSSHHQVGGDDPAMNNEEVAIVELPPQDHEIPDANSAFKEKAGTDRLLNPKRFKNITNQSKRLIIILERANLEVVKVKTAFELLNTDDHGNFIRKHGKDPTSCRPDILHQCLLMLFDSPLNRAGLLQVYIHTEKNVLIEVNPQTRFPRTFRRFAFLMAQLLFKLSIKASNSSEKLLRVVKNPITDHLPVGCRKLCTSFKATKIVSPRELVPTEEELATQGPLAIVVGAMAHGAVDVDYTEGEISISQYPLSAALTCTKICSAFEEAWGIV
ncbi:PREDICTED: ribosomal RNA small subunit methyltransferase NEP1-like [Rhagoletis zephyria]|uniref:ribosomal RNA small subunit methyltransferase NEP1-like n=1 Tax=Rhagoletis zephyria TaxID=28612 RepID=UPI000811AB03|nr:PREDICTED: ribosomal RNA small subunit methyltransferase NEP1-like [Rhagoletis zephyria]